MSWTAHFLVARRSHQSKYSRIIDLVLQLCWPHRIPVQQVIRSLARQSTVRRTDNDFPCLSLRSLIRSSSGLRCLEGILWKMVR